MQKGFFIERLDGKPVNMTLIQTIYIDPNDNTDIIWFMKNGEIYREDLATEEEATKRYKDLKGLLLGTTVAELQGRINEQQKTIVELHNNIDSVAIDVVNINGEEV